MRCPYCNTEMEAGYIKSSHFMHWGTEKKLGYNPNDIKLVNGFWKGLFKGFFVEAHHCSTCGKITVSLDEPHKEG